MSQSDVKSLAKPSGISLDDHTKNVAREGTYILNIFPFLSEKYKKLCRKNIHEELLQAVLYHDWGKSHHIWQNACQKDFNQYKTWREQSGLSNSKFSPEDYRHYEREIRQANKIPAHNLFTAGLRHEFASLDFIERNLIHVSMEVKAAIAAHHGKLSYRHRNRWKNDGKVSPFASNGPYAKYWDLFEGLSDEISDLNYSSILKNRYQFAGVRTLLQLADTRASRKEGEGEQANYQLTPFPEVKKFPSLRPVQRAALEISKYPIGILRAPTGSGKTFAALLWAEQQVIQKRADRLVIAMPTRFTSNALSISAAEQIGETGLYHSSAWHSKFGHLGKGVEQKEALEAHRMAKYFVSPVTVCTIDHLLICLTGTREYHHSAFFFLANSAVVFDEADFYDPFVQANMVVLIEALRVLDVPVLIMSATVPDSARKLYQIPFPIASPQVEDQHARKMIQFTGTTEEEQEKVLKKMLDLEHGIIYANTVSRAIKYYRWLKQNTRENTLPIIVYHSRFLEYDKKRIENILISILGQDAWKNASNKRVKGIAIMTQIGEMSINISTSIMLSDLCPWDRLAQRIGRLVRFDFQSSGECYIVEPSKNGQSYPAPYGSFDRKKKTWQPLRSFLETKQQLQKDYSKARSITPKELVLLVNNLYPEAPAINDLSASNQRAYLELIKHNWLITPDMRIDEDEGHAGISWSSRNIPVHQTVFVEPPHDLSDYSDLQSFELEYGISVPTYLLERELRKGKESRICRMKIQLTKVHEELELYFTTDYDQEIGLAFLYEDDLDVNVENQILD